jgi:hypothetical protein
MKKKDKVTTIPIHLEKGDRKKIDALCKKYGIKMNEFFNRAVFAMLFDLSHRLEPKERMQTLKRILDKDVDLWYYEARVEAIKELEALEYNIG